MFIRYTRANTRIMAKCAPYAWRSHCSSLLKCVHVSVDVLNERNWDDKMPAVHWIDWEKPRMTRNETLQHYTQKNRTKNLLPLELWWRATTVFHNSLNKFGLQFFSFFFFVSCHVCVYRVYAVLEYTKPNTLNIMFGVVVVVVIIVSMQYWNNAQKLLFFVVELYRTH